MQKSTSEMIIEAIEDLAAQAPGLIQSRQQKLRGQLEQVPDAAALKGRSWGEQYEEQAK